jgi:hypothetical protein
MFIASTIVLVVVHRRQEPPAERYLPPTPWRSYLANLLGRGPRAAGA